MLRRVLPVLALLTLTACAAPAETAPETIAPTTAPETTQAATVQTTAPAEPERFVLTFAGDCTLGSNPVNRFALCGFPKTVGEDYGHPFRNVLEYFENDELTLVNLEGPLCDSGVPAQKTHVFRGPTEYVQILTQGSVEAVSLANNHTLDYGRSAYDETRQTLEAAGIAYVERDSSVLIVTPSGLKVGIYGAVYYRLDTQDMAAELAALAEQGADILVYAPHWGTEYTYTPTARQREVARAAIDAGADIVVGTHPHVLQPMETYGGGVIFYSLGNFSFGGNTDPGDFDTVVVRQEVLRQADGTVELGQTTLVPASISSRAHVNNYQPTPYPEGSQDHQRVLEKLAGTWRR